MNREDITRMAREAGFVGMDGDHGALRRFAALVAAAEREACAKLCEMIADTAVMPTANECAKAIRRRRTE